MLRWSSSAVISACPWYSVRSHYNDVSTTEARNSNSSQPHWNSKNCSSQRCPFLCLVFWNFALATHSWMCDQWFGTPSLRFLDWSVCLTIPVTPCPVNLSCHGHSTSNPSLLNFLWHPCSHTFPLVVPGSGLWLHTDLLGSEVLFLSSVFFFSQGAKSSSV